MSEAARTRWSAFICDSASGGRYLSSVGSATSWAYHEKTDEVLGDFLRRLAGGEKDVQVLASALDLLRPDYLVFLSAKAPALLDHLSNEMIGVEEVCGPGLRGNPKWDRTILGRISGHLPPGRYITRTAYRSFERPENLLLRWLLDSLLRAVHLLRKRLGVDNLHPQLRLLLAKCEELARHHWLATVTVPTRLQHDMLLAAKRHRRPEYREAAVHAERRQELDSETGSDRWKSILSLLSAGWLEPVETDDIFELYALTLCLDVIATELGFGMPKEVGLVIRGRSYVASFSSDKGTVKLYFDQSPRSYMGVDGRSSTIISAHQGLTGSARRPDIAVVYTPYSGRPRTVFVEVKNSHSPSYISDSIYKAFGYLYDFAEIWPSEQKNPRVILFVPGNIKLTSAAAPEVCVCSADDRAALGQLLRSAFELQGPEKTA